MAVSVDSKVIHNSSEIQPNCIYFKFSCIDRSLQKPEEILHTLDENEKISLIFLLFDPAEATIVKERLNMDKSYNPILKWCYKRYEMNDETWELLLLESLTLLQNFKVLKQLGFNKYDMLYIFKPNIPFITIFMNPVKKILYKLCECLTNQEKETFISYMEEGLDTKICEKSTLLEPYILKWDLSKHIRTEKEINVSKVVNVLKKMKKQYEADELLKFVEKLDLVKSIKFKRNCTEEKNNEIVMKNDLKYFEIIDVTNVGLCVIINQQDFFNDTISVEEPRLQLKFRQGSEVDCDELEKTMKSFNFQVEIKENLNHDKIIPCIKDEIKKNFKKNHTVFMLVILSHGEEGAIYGANSRKISTESIKTSLNEEALRGKPKVVIIQACQGKLYLEATDSPEQTDTDETMVNSDGNNDIRDDIKPGLTEFLFCVATVPGFRAFRHIVQGSWYIQAICKILKEYPEEDIKNILTMVNSELSQKEVKICSKKVKMVPQFTSCFSKLLCLKRRKPPTG